MINPLPMGAQNKEILKAELWLGPCPIAEHLPDILDSAHHLFAVYPYCQHLTSHGQLFLFVHPSAMSLPRNVNGSQCVFLHPGAKSLPRDQNRSQCVFLHPGAMSQIGRAHV